MSKKDYEAFAAMIRRYVENGGAVGVERLIDDMARIFASDNPRFDRSRFIVACGLED